MVRRIVVGPHPFEGDSMTVELGHSPQYETDCGGLTFDRQYLVVSEAVGIGDGDVSFHAASTRIRT